MFGLSIDRENLGKLIRDFNTLTGIRIAFFTTDGKQLIESQKHLASFCSILRKDAKAEANCSRCDRDACLRAQDKGGLYLYHCHAGLTEAISPLIINSELVAYMMFGQVLDSPPSEELWQKILRNCSSYQIDYAALKEAFFKLQGMEWEKLQAAASIMEMSTKYIHMSRVVTVRHLSVIERIKSYIEKNLYKPLTISELSTEFSLSKSYLSRLIKDEFKMTLSDYILKSKIEMAERLLNESDLTVKDIGIRLGFADPNYFSRAFRKAVGISPSEYRKK